MLINMRFIKVYWRLQLIRHQGFRLFSITLKFDRHLGSSVAKVSVIFQGDAIIITSNLADSKLHGILRQDAWLLSESLDKLKCEKHGSCQCNIKTDLYMLFPIGIYTIHLPEFVCSLLFPLTPTIIENFSWKLLTHKGCPLKLFWISSIALNISFRFYERSKTFEIQLAINTHSLLLSHVAQNMEIYDKPRTGILFALFCFWISHFITESIFYVLWLLNHPPRNIGSNLMPWTSRDEVYILDQDNL